MWSASIGLFAIGNAIAFGMSAILWQEGAITLGTVYLIFQYTELLRRPIEEIRGQMQDLQQAGASVGRIEDLLRIQPKVHDPSRPEQARPLPHGALGVEFEDVSFGYADDEPVLRGVSLRVEPGRLLGLLGRTGSGKSTVTRLLLRFYDPERGVIRLGGVDLRDAKLADLRNRIGMVTQEVQLLHASVRDNLTLFDPAIPDDRILEVLRDLGLGNWYSALADGLDTELASGTGLSAGEAQLLAFCRVFLRDPGLVILDEASSRLDPATERLIQRATDQLLVGRTGIIIAHHLATVDRVDDVVILEDGEVVERGARVELANDPSTRFSELARVSRRLTAEDRREANDREPILAT